MKAIDKSLILTIGIVVIISFCHYLIIGTFLPCIINKITGLYCPGCGITRMLLSILKLDFYQAFRYNPLLFIFLILFIVYQIIKLITIQFFNKDIKLNNYVYIFLLIITIGFGVIRNIPIFSYLIPTLVK